MCFYSSFSDWWLSVFKLKHLAGFYPCIKVIHFISSCISSDSNPLCWLRNGIMFDTVICFIIAGFRSLLLCFTLSKEQAVSVLWVSMLHLQSQVFGLLVWTLIGGTEYLHVPALGWVMFVSVFCWVLTVILFLLYLTMAHTRIPQIPWKILVSKLE